MLSNDHLTSPAARLTAALAAALVLAGAGTATADPGTATAPPSPAGPVVGGEQLGRPDVQVAPDAPALPQGLTGMSWLVADGDTGDVLAAYRPHLRLPPASTLKMLFADVVLPKLDRDAVHHVAPEDLAGMGEGSSLVGIKEDQDYTVADLWRGVFLASGNDAVHVLAHMNGGIDQTVQEMNRKAGELGAADTHVVSPDGYDNDGQLTSAYDLTLFAREGLRNADFRTYCGTKDAQFPGVVDKTTGQRGSFGIENTDRLLGKYPGLFGVKNGYTTNAGSTFVGAAKRDGRTLLVAVMHPDSYMKVYEDTAALLDWGFAAGHRARPIGVLVAPAPDPASAAATAADRPTSPPPATTRVPSVQASASGDRTLNPKSWTLIGTAVTLAAAVLARLLNRRHRRAATADRTGAGSGPGGSGGEPSDGPPDGNGSTAIGDRPRS